MWVQDDRELISDSESSDDGSGSRARQPSSKSPQKWCVCVHTKVYGDQIDTQYDTHSCVTFSYVRLSI